MLLSKTKTVLGWLQVSVFAVAMSCGFTSAAQAITLNLSWTGTDDYDSNDILSLTGTFTGNDNDGNGIITGGTNTLGTTNEFTSGTFIFKNVTTNMELAAYDLNTDLFLGTPPFNLNYDIASRNILQFGNSTDIDGFSIGLDSGYILETTAGVISFIDSSTNYGASGGTLTVTPVPWETDALPVVGSTVLFGFGVYSKRKFANKR